MHAARTGCGACMLRAQSVVHACCAHRVWCMHTARTECGACMLRAQSVVHAYCAQAMVHVDPVRQHAAHFSSVARALSRFAEEAQLSVILVGSMPIEEQAPPLPCRRAAHSSRPSFYQPRATRASPSPPLASSTSCSTFIPHSTRLLLHVRLSTYTLTSLSLTTYKLLLQPFSVLFASVPSAPSFAQPPACPPAPRRTAVALG